MELRKGLKELSRKAAAAAAAGSFDGTTDARIRRGAQFSEDQLDVLLRYIDVPGDGDIGLEEFESAESRCDGSTTARTGKQNLAVSKT